MNEERHQELLGHLLDDELDADQAAELADGLRTNPGARSDVRRNLFLWELYSQQRRSERSADAFAESCKTRILAEADESTFTEGVTAKLRQASESASATADRAAFSLAERLRRHFVSLRWVMSATVAMLFVAVCVWLFPLTSNEPTLTVETGTRVTLERRGQSLVAQDGVKLLPGDQLRISGSNGAAITYSKERTSFALNDQTELKILERVKGKRFELRQGIIEARVARQRPFQPMMITTPQAEARVLGTRFTLTVNTNSTRLDVSEGKVRFTRNSDDSSVKVTAGNYAVAEANRELAVLPFTGNVLREWWSAIDATNIAALQSNPRFPDRPDGSDLVKSLEFELLKTNHFAVRLSGWLHPPVTGDYEFWIAGSDAYLLMSPSDDPSEKGLIAQTTELSGKRRNWDEPRFHGGSQWAPPVPLEAGRIYYIEAIVLIKQREGHLSVAWKRPGGERELVGGEFMSLRKTR